MTNLSDTLAALSEAAADDSKSLLDRVRATSAFHQALVDAYFDGQLVPVPGVERVENQQKPCKNCGFLPDSTD